MNNTCDRYSRIKRILICILIFNWLVAFVKIIFGLISRSISITADGFHSLSDGASNILGLIGIHFASFPKDKDHPYGHKKYETLFSLSIAGLLFFTSINLFKTGLTRLFTPVIPQVDILSFIIMALTLTINIAVMKYEYKQGRYLESDILISDSLHTKTDIITSLSVIITLAGIKFGFAFLDPIAAIVIALFIAYAAFKIIRQGSKILCDTAAIVDIKEIEKIVLGINGVKTCHKIRTRGRTDDICVDLHVQVDPQMHVDKAHKISYAIESAIKKAISGVTDVLVHIEPKKQES